MKTVSTCTALGLSLAALLTLARCTPEKLPGDLVVGTFHFESALQRENCGFTDAGADLTLAPFTGTVSLSTDEGTAYLTVNGADHVGTLEKGLLMVASGGERRLPPPFESDAGACPGRVEEQVAARLFDQAETLQLLGRCPALESGTDGGLFPPPPPALPDAGPAQDEASDAGMPDRDAGFDVRLICGAITDNIAPAAEGCAAKGCQVIYSLTGIRQ